jgi:hypothetical protein
VRNGINRGDPSRPLPDGENAVYAGSDLDLDFACAPPSKVTRGREYLIQKDQGAALHAGIKITKFSFDSTFVTFFELVLTFY